MGKFRIRVKLQGFELEVDGDRADMPAITSAVQQQFAGLLPPSEVIEEGRKAMAASTSPTIEGTAKSGSRSNSRKRSPRTGSEGASEGQAIEFRHDSGKFGAPQQAWSVAQKCIWLLFVLEGSGSGAEIRASQLTATFNSQFKAAGKLHPPNVTRDLAKAKVSNPAPLGEDKGKWFLTEEGKRQAQDLVQQSLTPGG